MPYSRIRSPSPDTIERETKGVQSHGVQRETRQVIRWLSGEHLTDLDSNSKESRTSDSKVVMSEKWQSTPSNQRLSMTVGAVTAETGKVSR
jgi:hypothetical protein